MELTVESAPDPEDVRQIWDGLRGFNTLYAGPANHQTLAVFVKDEGGELAGGLLGDTYWRWLRIDALWLRDDLRGSGWGRRVMAAAEAEALRRGCRHAYVDTHEFQAPGFYEVLGYRRWGVLEDFPTGYRRIFYRKDLE